MLFSLFQLKPTWKLLIWSRIVNLYYNHQCKAWDPPLHLLAWQLHSRKQTQFNLQQCVQGCPAQWDLCGFPGCALDVVYVFRLLRDAWAVVVIFFILWHFLEINACEQMSWHGMIWHVKCVNGKVNGFIGKQMLIILWGVQQWGGGDRSWVEIGMRW